MALTQLGDVIEPEVYASYVDVNDPELTVFAQSGIAVTNAVLQEKANTGGSTIELPFWNDLDADDEPNLSDASDDEAVPGKVDTGKQIAEIAYLNNGWGSRNLVGEIAGSDPNRRIAGRVNTYWQRQFQRRLLAICQGVLADNVANDGSDMVVDIAIEDGDAAVAANLISRSAVVNAAFTLGDAFTLTGAMAMHSTVYKRLVDLDDIEFIKDSTGSFSIPTYMGKAVLVDDTMTAIAGGTSGVKYTTIMFGGAAIGFGVGTPKRADAVAYNERAGNGAGDEELWSRKTWLIHPQGFQFLSASVAGQSATLAELRLAANWDRVHDRKLVPIAFLVTNG